MLHVVTWTFHGENGGLQVTHVPSLPPIKKWVYRHMGGAGPLLVVPQTDTDLGLLDTHPTIDLMQVSLFCTEIITKVVYSN